MRVKSSYGGIHLFEKLQFNLDQDIVFYNDNLQTIRILTSEMGKIDTKLRHIDVAQCWLMQSVQRGELCVDYVPTNQMFADGLTKILPPRKHQHFVKLLGIVKCHRPGQQSEEGKYGHKLNRPKSLEIKVKHGNFSLNIGFSVMAALVKARGMSGD